MANSGSLNLENLVDPEDLFRISGEGFFDETNDGDEPSGPDAKKEDKEIEHQVIDGDGGNLFDHQESVDDEDDPDQKEDTVPEKGRGSSPNIYSSIAKDFKEEGVFPDLDDDEVSKLDSAEGLSELINKQIEKRLDDTQKRVLDALNADVEPSQIRQYESTLSYLRSISEDALSDESDDGINLRRNLIYRDLLNRGYKEDRAKRLVKKSFDNGQDLEDAKDALDGNIQHFEKEYSDLLNEAKEEKRKEVESRKQEMDKIRKSIENGEKIIGDFIVPENMRQKVYESISKPVYKDPETGEMMTAVQKFAADNQYEFLKAVGTLYTLTNGFKDMSALIGREVNKKTKKSLKNLTDALNNTTRNSDGSFRMVTGVSSEKETYSGSDDWTLDV